MYSHDNSVHNYDQAYIVCLNIEQYYKLTYVHSMLTSSANVKPKGSYILAAVTLQCCT